MPRLAWFTPLPPVTSGVARYNVELLPGLTTAHQIDLFVDGRADQFVRPDADVQVFSAHDFVWKHLRQPYDLIIYQLGNAPCHDYIWAYVARYPGLVVLHDGQFHHSRGRVLMRQKREDDYLAEFRFGDPRANPDLAELGIAGLLGSLTYLWPMRRAVVESSRFVVVHNQWLADQIREESPNARVAVVDMGVPAPDQSPHARQRVLARHRIPPDALLITAFGNVTPEKRIRPAIHALSALMPSVPHLHLMLVGGIVDHYDALAEADELGVAGRVTVTGFVRDEEVAEYLAGADVCLCMRWPSSRETSAAWLRCLAAGRPTVVTDLVHMVDIPALDPRNWTLLHAPAESSGEFPLPPEVEPACISIDVLDEDHSLRLALRRLATDARLRAALGRSAHKLWTERFTLDRMVSRYLVAIETALAAPPPDASTRARLPGHFLTDGTEHAVDLLRRMELPESSIDALWHAERREP